MGAYKVRARLKAADAQEMNSALDAQLDGLVNVLGALLLVDGLAALSVLMHCNR